MARKNKAPPEPILLTGRVFLDGFLAQEVGYPLPAALKAGDLKLHRVARAGSLQRYGETIKYSGFLVGSVYDGKRWRRLLLRQKAAVDATYMGLVDMREKAYKAVGYLKRLAAEKAYWVEKDSGFEVCRKEPVVAAASTPSPAPAVTTTPSSEAVLVKPEKENANEKEKENDASLSASDSESGRETAVTEPPAGAAFESIPVQTSLFPDLPGGRMKRVRKKTKPSS